MEGVRGDSGRLISRQKTRDQRCAARIGAGPFDVCIYIYNMDEDRDGMICECVNDAKIGDIVGCEEGYLRLQQYVDELGKWAK